MRLKEALGKRYHSQYCWPQQEDAGSAGDGGARGANELHGLLGGESGVGKDLIARAIHEKSRRASGPFIKINSTAIPENFLESELFGY